VHTTIDHFVTESFMGAVGSLVLDERIRGHFDAPVSAGPVLCRVDQLPADPALAVIFGDVPTFDIAD
jgi:hypothetical protein